MDEKAANYGDRLKHALLLEVLVRTAGWPDVVYAETHAGAGVYDAGDQVDGGYIHGLRQIVEDAAVATDGPGAAYLTWLKAWWTDPANRESYPGSALTVLRWLQYHRTKPAPDIRLTENDEANCRRLRQAVNPLSHAVRNDSFVSELEWLTGADNLVLLVDPFGCVTSFTAAERGLDSGRIDHATVLDILRRCAKKERAIVSLWWGYGQTGRDHHRPTCELLAEWAQRHPSAVCRVFHDPRNHANAQIGIGGGAEVVRGLPRRAAWKGSWLGDAVYERK